ncbi:tripartite motif-containing protein 2-like [Magallana gigas]|uniref:tripartite motif-containing protein 2-like n=1 Tax=Magallana gigas TaxID=29159 RepID=UPI003340A025
MALSKTVGPGVVQDVPVIAQHYLVCDTEDCENNCQFYCNPCHLQLCEQCSDEHQKSPATKNHEVVPYRQRKRKLPVEKCKDHPSKDIDMICENCQVAVCSKCSIRVHRGHTFDDLEIIYSENFTLCLDEIYNVNQYYLPTSQDLKRDIKEVILKLRAFMDKIKTFIIAEVESLKRLVEKVMTDNLEQANKLEETLLEKLQSQGKTYDDYKCYLENLVKEFQGSLSFDKVQNNSILFSLSELLNIKPIPQTTEPVYPVFTAGQYSKDDVAKLLGTVTAPKTKPEFRKIQPMETTSTHLKLTRRLKERDGWKMVLKQTLSLSSTVTNVRKYKVAGVDCVFHISVGKSGILWASDNGGNLVQTDLQGKQLQMIKTSGRDDGYHTVSLDGNLIFADKTNCSVNSIIHGKTITRFITTKECVPLSIHTSNLNGDILVGMGTRLKGKVARYNKRGKEIHNIERDNKGQELYSEYPHYITENINGDICVSDFNKQAVIVVNKIGQHRFSYTGQESKIRPYGICTDILGHILVCDINSKTVHLLDQDGQFLSLLVTSQKGIKTPRGVCVDGDYNLHVGDGDTNTVIVYKYLQ